MCTIIILKNVHPEYPVVIAANRDEYLARRTTNVTLLNKSPRTVGGRDEKSGGTWMGANEYGIFASVTNQRTFSSADSTKASRGDIPFEILKMRMIENARAYVEALDPSKYNPFNLIFGNQKEMWVAYAHPGVNKMALEPVPDGVHVLPNDVLDSPAFSKVVRAVDLLGTTLDVPFPVLMKRLVHVLGNHETPPFEHVPMPPNNNILTRAVAQQLDAICIHTPTYGTRSATVIALDNEGVAEYRYANGPTCRTDFVDVRNLLDSPSEPPP
ncbi:MAG: NRDE family protein [Sandaracinaceae bacterium]|nr:NRDE family protein [Sandaracinaceae bacterium]